VSVVRIRAMLEMTENSTVCNLEHENKTMELASVHVCMFTVIQSYLAGNDLWLRKIKSLL